MASLEPPENKADLAPFSFMLVILERGRAAVALRTFYERCGYTPWSKALMEHAQGSPAPFLGGASVVCKNSLDLNPLAWKSFVTTNSHSLPTSAQMLTMLWLLAHSGWGMYFESLKASLGAMPSETLALKKVRKTLNTRIWPSLKRVLLSIGNEESADSAVESGLEFFSKFLDTVVLMDTDSLCHTTLSSSKNHSVSHKQERRGNSCGRDQVHKEHVRVQQPGHS